MQYRLKFEYLIILGMASLYATHALGITSEKSLKPNVVLIYTDDHRYTGVHALGKQAVKTPHMDELVQQGISFTHAYLMGAFSGATCIPSRAMLLTGRNLFQLQGEGHGIPKEHHTIGEAFKQADYHTHMVGKWHQDNQSLLRSFDSGGKVQGRRKYLVDHFRMPINDWDPTGEFALKNHYLMIYDEEGNLTKRPITNEDIKGPIGTEENGPHTSEIYADSAIEFIESYSSEEPFFMYLAFHAPHDPRQAPKKYKDLYPVDKIELPPSYMPQHPFDNGHMFLRDEELAPWPRTPEIARQELADYYAIITHMDDQIGRIISALKVNGMYENSIIVLAGDSGLAVGNHGLLGKQNIYDEDGIHVPFVLSGGRAPAKGKEINALCYIHDIFPTICDLAEISKPDSVSGLSLKPVIDGKTNQLRNYTYHAYRQHQRAYRKGDFKLIEYVRAKDYTQQAGEFVTGSRVTQLFNVKKDPWETLDLSFFPEYKELLTEMRLEIREKAVELGDQKEHVHQKYDFWDFY